MTDLTPVSQTGLMRIGRNNVRRYDAGGVYPSSHCQMVDPILFMKHGLLAYISNNST